MPAGPSGAARSDDPDILELPRVVAVEIFGEEALAVISTFLIAITLLAVVLLDRLVGIRQLAGR